MTKLSISKSFPISSKFARYGLIATGIAAFGSYQLTRPYPLSRFPVAHPAKSYSEALAMINDLAITESQLNERCNPKLLTHGHKTKQAIALIHGYTNCPYQFSQLAPLFFERGYNVYLPRLPKHGLADRLSPLQGNLTATDLLKSTSKIVDVLCGLGESITLLGFSLGGVLAGWAAQHRAELDHTVLVSPAFATDGVPIYFRNLYANLFRVMPNHFQWWDPQQKDARLGPQHAYPRWSTRGVGAMLRLGSLVELEAQQYTPASKRLTVVTNPCDQTVNNTGVERVIAGWQRHGVPPQRFAFNSEWNLIHDLIDPEQPEQQIERVYPQLIEWVEAK